MKILKLELKEYHGVKHLCIDNPPDLVVLIGPNGSGKSTALRALNEGLNYYLGLWQSIHKGIGLWIDISDHFKEIKSFFTDPSFEKMIRNKIRTEFSYISEGEIKEFLEYFKNEIFAKFADQALILEVTNGTIRLYGDYEQPEDPSHSPNLKSISPTKDYAFWYSDFFHEWFKTRNEGNIRIPSFAYFEAENNEARRAKIDVSKVKDFYINRIKNINSQTWRTENLGQRIINLILTYNRKKNLYPNKQDQDPIIKINESLQVFLPNFCLISPESTDTDLLFKVRDYEIPLNRLSSGELSLINFAIDFLEIEISSGILIIDEPSSHLHYDLQSRLIPFLEELVTNYIDEEKFRPQIWLATHSPPIIHSAPEESIYYINIDDQDQVAKPLKDIEGSGEYQQLLTLLGISHFFDRRPILFVEGSKDIEYLNTILRKFRLDLLTKWHLKSVNGVKRIDEIQKYSNELKKIANNISAKNLIQQLKQNHFLRDQDQEADIDEFEDKFRWQFYHFENLLFQDPWFEILKKIIRFRQNNGQDIDEALRNAIEWTYNDLDPRLDESLEKIIEDDSWKIKLPGRKIFSKWRGNLKLGGFSEKNAFKKLMRETNSAGEVPEELKRLIDWLETKYHNWLSA